MEKPEKSTGAFLRVGWTPKNGGGYPQEGEKKKRKNTVFNCNVFKSEYSIQSLLLVAFVLLTCAMGLRPSQVSGG